MGGFNWLSGALGGFLPGSWSMGAKKEKMKKLPTMTPGQEGILNQLIEMLGGGGQLGSAYKQSLTGLTDLLDPSSEAYQKFADPYMKQFEQETVPMLAEKFAGAGGGMGGALSSSGFGQSLSAASGNLQSNLASMKTQMMQKAMEDIMQQFQAMSGQALGAQPFAYYQQPGQKGFGESFTTGGGLASLLSLFI